MSLEAKGGTYVPISAILNILYPYCRTIQNVCEGEWGPIPLVFICRGLASLPAAPCLDKTTVLATRKLLTGYLVAVETYFRGIIQVYTVRILLKLIDKNKVPLEDFLQILTLVKRDECFLKGTKIWQETVDFLAGEEISDPNSKGVAYEAMGTDIGPASSWTGPGVKAILEQGLTKYLDTELDSRYSSADHIPALTVARLLMLTANESMATKLRDECPCATLRQACQKIAGIVNAINNHVYMSQHKADKAILLLHLLRLEMGLIGMDKMDPASLVIQDTVTTCRDELLVYISRRTLEDLKEMDDVPLLDLYMDSIDMVARAATLSPVKFTNLVNTCTTCLSRLAVEQSLTLHRKLQQLSCMSIMGAVANFLSCDTANQRYLSVIGQFKEFLQKWTIMTSFSKPTAEKSLSQQEWGKLASQFLQNQWQVVMVTIVKGGAPWCALTELLPLAIETLSVGVEETAIVVLKCLIQIIPKVVSEGSCPDASLCQILESSWACVQEARRIPSFWNVLEAFVQVAYLPCLLSFPKDSLVIQNLRNYADKLIEQGVDKNGVVNVLANQIYRALFPPDMIRHAGKFVGLIIDLCMFGGLVRRGVRQVYEICAALKEAGEDCPENTLLLPIINEDIQVKIKVTSLLCHLDPADSTHCCLATEVVQLCCAQYVKVADGSTNRFANSLVHRQRHRLIQTVLLLQELVTMESVEPLWEFSWSSLEVETQPSIRHMLEWLIVWAMYRHKHLRHKIWALFEKFHDTKNLTMCSLLGIVIHLGPHLPADEQEEYYSRSMQHILPWCMAHHFQTRIYSQAVLVKLWEQSAQLGLHQIHTRNPILQTMVDFNQSNCNSTKNVKRLLDSFFFKFLDFKKDFMLETLYYIMPKMTALTEEDWIHPKLFTLENPHWTEGGPPKFIGVENERNKFKECDPAQWRYLTMRNFEDVEDIDGGGGGDVQKKIMPWQQMALEEDVVAEVEHGVKPPVGAGLVVVTSLINKVPNLGGLCRTSEIFGVSEYVLGKLQYAEDKAFQGLSVTAHKWIPITEVHEDKLSDYLQHKRLEGYTLVGVEQTAHSVCLTEYTFPTKTLLLLGNEKEGIPVELISLLDVCVEIPQQGVVRSLNVHVSGAILIWEYRRQQLMKNAAAS
ncbi:hypothetical protein DPMN_087475 [Dreissena polymorpha]|uniref:tRNA (guanosine(18)-2'-O)-methyltransferase TARBP1 n=1 Tax=Dreissena polymorpha TaxID=45954 RepID=A0A9D4KSV5_DREPO|nr:hypothetical protein DPMN_087475 [Dreissena polymorpha]